MIDVRKVHFLQYGFLGMALVIISLAIMIINPLEIIVNHMLSIQEGTYAMNLFKNPPLDIFVNVYVWNVTNSESFLAGKDEKLILSEVGPYVYKEILTNSNTTFNPNGTLTYIPIRRTEFIREKSVSDPHNDIIIAPNIPMLGLTTLASETSFFAALAVGTLVKTTSSQPFLNLTVQDYLWGYNDRLVLLASSIVPGIIPFKKFGLLDRMFDDGINIVTINLPKTNEPENTDTKKPLKSNASYVQYLVSSNEDDKEDEDFYPLVRDYSIDVWNGSPGLHHWGWNQNNVRKLNTACNTLRGNYDGTLFPRNISKSEVFKYYRKCFCRTLPIEYTHPGKIEGIEAYWFKLANHAFESRYDDPETACFCNKDKCMKRGLGNITPCYWNIPAAVSLPHFYNSDSSLVDGVEGMKPNKEKHDSIIALQPQLGIPMKVKSRIQINLIMGSIKFNNQIENLQNTALPIFWAEISVDKLNDELLLMLKLLFLYLPKIQLAIIVFFCVIGAVCFFFGVKNLLYSIGFTISNPSGIQLSAIVRYSVVQLQFQNEHEPMNS